MKGSAGFVTSHSSDPVSACRRFWLNQVEFVTNNSFSSSLPGKDLFLLAPLLCHWTVVAIAAGRLRPTPYFPTAPPLSSSFWVILRSLELTFPTHQCHSVFSFSAKPNAAQCSQNLTLLLKTLSHVSLCLISLSLHAWALWTASRMLYLVSQGFLKNLNSLCQF